MTVPCVNEQWQWCHLSITNVMVPHGNDQGLLYLPVNDQWQQCYMSMAQRNGGHWWCTWNYESPLRADVCGAIMPMTGDSTRLCQRLKALSCWNVQTNGFKNGLLFKAIKPKIIQNYNKNKTLNILCIHTTKWYHVLAKVKKELHNSQPI